MLTKSNRIYALIQCGWFVQSQKPFAEISMSSFAIMRVVMEPVALCYHSDEYACPIHYHDLCDIKLKSFTSFPFDPDPIFILIIWCETFDSNGLICINSTHTHTPFNVRKSNLIIAHRPMWKLYLNQKKKIYQNLRIVDVNGRIFVGWRWNLIEKKNFAHNKNNNKNSQTFQKSPSTQHTTARE